MIEEKDFIEEKIKEFENTPDSVKIIISKKDFRSLLQTAETLGRELERKELLEKVNEVKKRFRCAACEGSKCQHTLGCQALDEIKTEIKVDLNNK